MHVMGLNYVTRISRYDVGIDGTVVVWWMLDPKHNELPLKPSLVLRASPTLPFIGSFFPTAIFWYDLHTRHHLL